MSMTLLEKAAIVHAEAKSLSKQVRGREVRVDMTMIEEQARIVMELAGLVEALAAGPEPFLFPWQTRVIDEAVALANVREKEAGAEETRLKWIEGSRVSHEPEVGA
jgi:hypothetical protein